MAEPFTWKHPVIHDAAPQVRRCTDAEQCAERVATSLVGALLRIQALGRTPSVVLTGGSIAEQVHAAVLDIPDVDLVDWTGVDFWWGDERYVARDDDDRNAKHARAAMLEPLGVPAERIHEMPAADGDHGSNVEAAAEDYAARLLASVPADGPWFDIVMLGIGDDGHCASLFPGRPEVNEPGPVLAVRNSPKPPPTRISMSMSTLRRTREVWFVASGSEKAEAVAAAVSGAEAVDVPAAGPHGSERTLWFVDADAAWML